MLDVLETMTLPPWIKEYCLPCGQRAIVRLATIRRYYPTYWQGPKPNYLCDDCRKAQDKQWQEEVNHE